MNSRQKCAWKSQTRLHTPQECQGRCQSRGISGLAFPVEGGRIHAKRTGTEIVQKTHGCTYLPLSLDACRSLRVVIAFFTCRSSFFLEQPEDGIQHRISCRRLPLLPNLTLLRRSH